MSAQAATTLHPPTPPPQQHQHHHHLPNNNLNVLTLTGWILLLSCWLRVLCFGDPGIQSLSGDCI